MKKNEFMEHESISWNEVRKGQWEKILYKDEVQGTYARILKFAPGFITGQKPMVHVFDECIYILEGNAANVKNPEEIFTTGMYAVFPKGTEHGPFVTPEGAMWIEFRHFPMDDKKM